MTLSVVGDARNWAASESDEAVDFGGSTGRLIGAMSEPGRSVNRRMYALHRDYSNQAHAFESSQRGFFMLKKCRQRLPVLK